MALLVLQPQGMDQAQRIRMQGIEFKPSYDRAKKESQPRNSNSPKMKLANALAAISDTEDDE